MKMNRQSLLPFWTGCLALLLLLAPSIATGADTKPPEKMAFQGFLTDANGAARGQAAPVNLEITFRLYKSSTADASAAVWSEKQTVTVDKGHFSVVLGDGVLVSGTANFANHFSGGDTDAGRYLGVQVTGEPEIAPRIQFFTAPYASLARYATELVGTAGTSVLKVGVDKVGVNLGGAPATALDVGGTATTTGLDVNGTTTLDGTTTVAGPLRITGNNFLEFGYGVGGKDASAGKFGYGTFTPGVLDIVGAGTTGGNRAVKIWAEAGTTFTGPVSAPSLSGTQTITAGGLRFDNGQFLQAKNSAGTYEVFLWPRWVDNVMYMNYGSGGFNLRNNSSATALFLENNGRATFSNGVLAKGGNPGGGNVNNVGYAFSGNGGDNDSGMFSDIDGHVRFFSNGELKLSVYPSGTYAHDRLHTANGLTLDTGSGRTVEITSSWLRILHPSDKGKVVDIDRVNNGVRIWATGGGFGNSGDFTRQIVWDGDGNWDSSSDRKLKKDIQDAEPILERALQVQLRRFRWKNEPAGAKMTMGVIAQELQPLFPDMVGSAEDKETGEQHLTVGYADFGMIAVKALQEFKALHDAEVKDLKAEVADLKAQMKQVLQAAAELRAQADKSKVTAAVGQ